MAILQNNMGPDVVEIGPVDPTDYLGRYLTGDTTDIYTDYKIENRYDKDLNIFMAGMTSTVPFKGRSVSFVQLSAPTLLWVVDWTAARYELKPDIPNPQMSQSSPWILLGQQIEPYMETVGPDGVTSLWRLSGIFYYGHMNPSPDIMDDINFPRPPWLKDTEPRNVPDSILTDDLIDD